jgi:hypothetical protein
MELPEVFATAVRELPSGVSTTCKYWFKNGSENYAVMEIDVFYFGSSLREADYPAYRIAMSVIVGRAISELVYYEATEEGVLKAMHDVVEDLKNYFRMSQTYLELLEPGPLPNETPSLWERLDES